MKKWHKREIITELSLVIVGGIKSGKSSVISILLGHADPQPAERTINCTLHHGHLRARRLTVVNTPGWWKDLSLSDTAQRTKYELLLGLRLCPPGPHAVVLTVETGQFTERNKKAVEEHLGLFGENVWEHTIVVFTRGEYLQGKSIEQHIESEGETLKWLVEKCGNRYCVLDKQRKKEHQAVELLKTIVSMVVNNNGRHFELDEKTLAELEEKKRAAQERASERWLKVEEIRNQLREKGEIQFLPEIGIVLLGWVISGKSSAKNVILNQEEHSPQSRTEHCEKDSGLVGDRRVTVVDTPGWWKYFSAQYTPDWVKTELKQSVTLCSESPQAFLLVVPADVSFLEEQRKIIEENMKMFGEMAWRHTLILFTWGDSLGNTSIEEHIESEGEPLRWLVEKCGNRYHVFDNSNRRDGSQVHELLEKIEEMEASTSLCELTDEASETTESIEGDTQVEEVGEEVVEFLDNEWGRGYKELDEKIKTVWEETFGSTGKGDRSINPDSHENKIPVGTSVEGSLPVIPQIAYPELKFLFSSECGQPDPHQQSAEEKVKEAFQREWEEHKAIIMDRIHGITVPKLDTSCEIPEQDEHKPPEQSIVRHMQEMISNEWARRDAVIMDKVQSVMLELFSQSRVFPSEPDEGEIEEARDQVFERQTGPSRHGSTLEDEDVFE